MKNYLTANELIEEGKKEGVDFGKGDPYNRLRYYTKIGWLPHMERMKTDDGSIKGHYPKSIIDRLLLIQEYKEKGLSNDEITEKLKERNKVQDLKEFVQTVFESESMRNKVITYTSFTMILIILAAELGILKIGTPRSQLIYQNTGNANAGQNIQIIDAGSAFMPKDEQTILVKNKNVFETSKIYVSFKEDFSPATKFWVSDQIPNEGFVLSLDAPLNENAEFDWWITN